MTGVSDYDIRVLEPADYRAAHTLFRGALHVAPGKDELWPSVERTYEPGRVFGAFRDDALVGTAMSFEGGLVVPGGAVVPMAMVSRVGVRADHTRRGVLTALMRAQLAGLAEPVATLRASEAPIYGRFGYGTATRGRGYRLTSRRARPHPGAPEGGRVRLVSWDEAPKVLPGIYDRIGLGRAGAALRPESWWAAQQLHVRAEGMHAVLGVHSGQDGDDGFLTYHVQRTHEDDAPSVLHVHDLWAGSPSAWAGLWRYVLGVDLVDEVLTWLRPPDEPIEWLLGDSRAVRNSTVDDETWLRLVDVPAALAARRFGDGRGGSVVVEVLDALLPANSGRYRLGDGPARRVAEPAALALDVAALGALYLGDVAPSTLAAVGRARVLEPAALPLADRVFATGEVPWCGTYF